MKRFRNLLFWCHLAVGLSAALVILILSVTGFLLTYERQIVAWADTRAYRASPTSAGARPLPVETLLAKVRETESSVPSTLTLRADPAAPAEVSFGRRRTLFVDRYSGRVLGDGSHAIRSFFRAVTDWHRWLGAQGENRQAARAVMGACNLGFLFLVVSGFYLWWPRNGNPQAVRNVVLLRRGLSGKARDFNWHNVIGFWAVVPLLLIVPSAVVISYPWASDLVYRLCGETPPPARRGPPEMGGARDGFQRGGTQPREHAAPLDGLDRLWVRAEGQVPGWRTISLRLPAAADASVAFTIDRGNGGQPQKRGQLTLNRTSGAVVRWEPFSSNTLGRRVRTLLRFAHTGEVAGIAGQTVAGLASAGGAVLVWTGLALAWRRFRFWKARRAREAWSRAASAPSIPPSPERIPMGND